MNLGSKITNHKMTKFPERSVFVCFLCRKFVVLLQCYWFVYRKSLTSFVPNKHVHWFIFLHFDPVQIVSLPQAHLTLTLLSVTFLIYWVVIVTELVTSQLFSVVSCYNNFSVFNWNC